MQVGELRIFSGRSNPVLAKSICDFVGTRLGAITIDNFPDGETFVRIEENIRGMDVFIVQSTCPPANEHIMELLIMIDAARRASAQRITAVMPFYGYSRQDRKDQPRVPITAKLVANLLSIAGADRVLTMDLHAQQIQGFFDIPVDHLYASPVFYDYLRKFKSPNLVCFSPDEGGIKMTAAYAKFLECGLGFVAKQRTEDPTKVEAIGLVGEVEGKDVLILDDITVTAGTLIAAANLLKERGAKTVRAAVSHGVLNDIAYERLGNGALDELITTDSTPVEPRDLPITVLSIYELFGEAILRIKNHESITSLFRVKSF